MIRAGIVTAAFLCFVILLVILQPGTERSTAHESGDEDIAVSRSAMELEALDELTDNLSLLNETVASRIDVAPPITKESAPVQPSEPSVSAGNSARQPASSAIAAAPQPEQMVIEALRQGSSASSLDQPADLDPLDKPISRPDTLLTEDGRVNTAALLSALQSDGLAGQGEVYVVQAGDSLKSISYRFFGSTAHALDIFMANRATVSSPSLLRPGQEIVIPSLN